MATTRKLDDSTETVTLEGLSASVVEEAERLTQRPSQRPRPGRARVTSDALAALVTAGRAIGREWAVREPELAYELLDALLELEAAFGSESAPADWSRMRALLQVRDLLGAMQRLVEARQSQSPHEAAAWLLELWAEEDQARVASVLGVSARSVRSWRHRLPARFSDEERLVVAASVVTELSRWLEPAAALRWWSRPRSALDGQTPLVMIESSGPEAAEEPLRQLARSGAAQLAT